MKKKSDTVKAIALINQIAISMIIPIVGGILLGDFLDDKFGTSPWFLLGSVFLGIGAGFRNIYAVTKSFTKKEDEE